jgi:hypothetical protein
VAGISGSVSVLAEVLVHVEVGHVVSSSSMVSRAYLVDNCVGVVVDAGELGYWLASALPVLAPDPDRLRVRAAEKGGIPAEHGMPRLAKVTLRWGESSVDLNNPTVVAGAGVGVVSLAVPASLGERIRSGTGPQPVVVTDGCPLGLGDEVGVVGPSPGGPLVRAARVSSDPGYRGITGALALDVGLGDGQAGVPVYFWGKSGPGFYGLAVPVDENTSLLVPAAAISAAIG